MPMSQEYISAVPVEYFLIKMEMSAENVIDKNNSKKSENSVQALH